MSTVRISEDIVPIAEFKTHASRLLRELRLSRHPVVITQNGRPAGVLISPAEYDRLMERDLFIAQVRQGLREDDAGLGVDDEDLDAHLPPHLRGPYDE